MARKWKEGRVKKGDQQVLQEEVNTKIGCC